MLTPEQELYETALSVRAFQRDALRLTVRVLEGRPCIDAPHHKPLCDALDAVVDGRIKRLLISIPPGTGKTLACAHSLMARGFLINPACRFLHTSYASELALSNSSKVRELLRSDELRLLGAPTIKDTSRAKGLWETVEGGTVRAAATGSAITGFRAGFLNSDEFSGAIIVDDPQKPAITTSRKQMEDTNLAYNNTIASRLADESIPIIVIQQRLAAFSTQPGDEPALAGDMSEFLLRGGSGENWHHLLIPAMVDNSLPYPDEWTHGEPISHGLPDGPLWPEKLSEVDCERLKRANKYVYAAQYQQRPKKRSGDSLIKGEWFKRHEKVPELKRIELFADTANKAKESSDYSVLLAAGVDNQNQMYVLDVLRKKLTIPELYTMTMDFWEKWKARGATRINIEDKASGTYLIQAMQEQIGYTVNEIPRHIDKFTRVTGVIERISSGHVSLPVGAPWVSDFLMECEDFTDDDSHAYDDQIDCLCDAIETLVHTKPVTATQTYNVGLM